MHPVDCTGNDCRHAHYHPECYLLLLMPVHLWRWVPPRVCSYGPLTRYAKLRIAHAPGMPGTFSPPPRVSDPDMHHGTCVTHVLWCTPGSITSGFHWSQWRENFPGIPDACATRNFAYLVRGPCRALPSLLSRYPMFKSSHCNSFGDWKSVCFEYVFKWVAVTS